MRKTVLLLAVLLVAGCGSSSQSQQQTETHQAPHRARLSVTLDWTPNPDHVGLYDALDRGLFAKQGLTVKIHPPSDATTPLKLVGAGRTDLAVSYEQEVFFAAARHLPVITVAAVVPQPLNSFMSLDPTVHTLADLRGKSIGITGVPSDTAILKAAGLAGHVKVVSVGYNLVPALVSHRVDAVLGVYRNVEGIQLQQRGLKPTIIPVDHAGVPRYDELVLVANKTRLARSESYRYSVRQFVHALKGGTIDARTHPQQALAILKKATASPSKFLAAATPATLALLTSNCLDLKDWQRFGDWLHAQGLLKEPIAAGEVATKDYCS